MVEILVRIDGVTHPADVAEVVFVTLVDSHIYIYACGVIGCGAHAIGYDIGVAVTDLVVFLNDSFLILLILLGHEFLGAEEVDDVVVIGFLHRLVNLVVRQGLVAGDVDVSDLGLDLFIHIDINLHVARMVSIVVLQHVNLGVVEAFFGEILLDDRFGAVGDVRGHLAALVDTDLHFNILFLAFLEAVIDYIRDAWTLLEANLEPYLAALYLGSGNLHVGEESLFPEPTDCFGDLVTGYFNLVAYIQAGETDDDEVLIAVGTADGDTGYFVRLAREGILDIGCIPYGYAVLRLQGQTHQREQGDI